MAHYETDEQECYLSRYRVVHLSMNSRVEYTGVIDQIISFWDYQWGTNEWL